MSEILTMSPGKGGWYTEGMPQDTSSVGKNTAIKGGYVPNQDLAFEQHRNLRKAIEGAGIPGVRLVDLAFPVKDELPKNLKNGEELGHLLDQSKDNIDSLVFIRDAFISNQEGLILCSNFRREQRRNQSRIMEILLNHQGYDTISAEKNEAYFEGGDFRYLPADKILFAGFGGSNYSRNSIDGVRYVADKFGLKSDNVVLIAAKGFHIDTVFSVVTGKDGKMIGAIACKGLIEEANYKELESFFKNKGCFLIGVEDSYGIPTSESEQNTTGAINTLNVNEYLFGSGRLSDEAHDKLEKAGVKFIEVLLDEYWKAGGGVHCLTNKV